MSVDGNRNVRPTADSVDSDTLALKDGDEARHVPKIFRNSLTTDGSGNYYRCEKESRSWLAHDRAYMLQQHSKKSNWQGRALILRQSQRLFRKARVNPVSTRQANGPTTIS